MYEKEEKKGPVMAMVWNEPQAMNRIRLPFKPSTILGASQGLYRE